MSQVAPASPSSPRVLALTGLALAVVIYAGQFVTVRHAVLNGLSSHDMTALRFGSPGSCSFRC